MTLFQTKEEYFEKFEHQINQKKSNQAAPILYEYMNRQFDQLMELIENLSKETYWQLIPQILGIDAKLSLLVEAIQFEGFSDTELIRMIEQDYCTYFKELCGYNLSMEPNQSLIFTVL